MWFDETTDTLFAGDLFTSLGDGPAIVESDLIEGALIAEDVFHQTSISTTVTSTIRTLAELDPVTIAVMHGRRSTATAAPSCGPSPTPTTTSSDPERRRLAPCGSLDADRVEARESWSGFGHHVASGRYGSAGRPIVSVSNE